MILGIVLVIGLVIIVTNFARRRVRDGGRLPRR